MFEEQQTKQNLELESKQSFAAYKNLGDSLAKQEKLDEAIASYQQAMELEPENVAIYRALGSCYYKADRYQETIINYDKAIALNKKQPFWVYRNLANVLANQKQLNEAIVNYEKAIAIEPQKSSLYVSLGNLYFQQKNLNKAFDCYLQAVQIEPNLKASYGRLGYFHNGHTSLSHSQLDRAINCYQQVINQQPSFFLPYVYLGDSLTAKGSYDRAISYYQIATQKQLLEKHPEVAESQNDFQKIEQPSFIIIGAGKSGTSSLYEYMRAHPQIISALKKEMRFFNYKPNFNKGVNWYLAHFPPILPEKKIITGEATPGYFGSDVQASISNLFPEIKLIAILRNPVDRAISQYNHWVRNGKENRSFESAVLPEIENLNQIFNHTDTVEFEQSKNIENICRQVRQNNSQQKTCYLWEGLYFYFLKKWMNYFSREQFLVLKSEDFYAQPEVEMEKVFAFLDLPDYRLTQYKQYNAGKYSSIDENLYKRISEFFQPHNQRLEEYLNRKFNWNN